MIHLHLSCLGNVLSLFSVLSKICLQLQQSVSPNKNLRYMLKSECYFRNKVWVLVSLFFLTSMSYKLVQKLKTSVVRKNCNPEWQEELTLTITDICTPINLAVYDKDTFTADDKMGDAEVDIQPYVESLKMGLKNLPAGCVVSRVQPNSKNCLADESSIVWKGGKLIQDMRLRLRNVESGEVEIQLEWINVPGCKGLEPEGTS
ncbi:hypothetical protein K2173_010129 [Erythroxylum novogranatense]|uniref:C2 domain-containing protein n=1 Tax=Erythroxylum novogranatense TaxID=1862640 RepID=A0AAV8TVY4_9ROSI|nr:hypothetical protein K2173_010129 [Erythroxylum novogranatense]